ncbi:hypothetical protein SYNTR_0769 [Candidatus Syntrophocurvum alkaliphilum]|uniref:Uncharacterized protein n=1 Tax=Candidatus Syntrophocurvum alkaliphilum TaxID=2293317 RepID=A0A6I6DEA8_9FIRM|nr:hypothetical protein [Candidatus Syntrophocurvum alkaliphilum]QGT99362.1 hypothetical protein SYNTR_0769 [Candidatus Syntrophocurvum alkaliphilum]
MVITIRKYWYFLLLIIIVILTAIIINKFNLINPEQPKTPETVPEKELIGEWLAWNEVNPLFPKYSYAKVTDIETNLSFAVQRRGGTYHVDVQPLTAKDTKIMKKIYNNQWSWKRRAVVVELYDGRLLAGSMNGMPHGGGSISDNNFNGHFCIHFKDSKTHGSRKVDLAHQMMIWKAAGIVDKQLKTLTAKETVLLFFTAIDQKDEFMFKKLLDEKEQRYHFLKDIEPLDSVKVNTIKEGEENFFVVDLRLKFKESNNIISRKLHIQTVRRGEQWKITEESTDLLICNEEPCLINANRVGD